MSRGDAERLADILEASKKISEYHQQSDRGNEMAADAMLYLFVVIGEAVNGVDPELLAREPEIPWGRIVGMRNYVAHQYHRVEDDILRDTVTEDLPGLREAVERLLNHLSHTATHDPQQDPPLPLQ